MEPNGPDMRCSSSWITSSGGAHLPSVSSPNRPLDFGLHGSVANLSTVPITSVGGSPYIASSITYSGRPSLPLNAHALSSQPNLTREGFRSWLYPLQTM